MTEGIEEAPKHITVPCLKVEQPLGTMYIASMKHQQICSIAKFDVRRVMQKERDFERYLGIQRPLRDDRVKKLKEYVHYFDAAFPSSIIIAVDHKCADYDEDTNSLILKNFAGDDENEQILFRNIARVLDGQHRIAGLMDYPEEKDFDVSVTIFVGMDLADQAQIFATVNLEQTKVNKSLVYDLFALAKTRSPQKTCHNIAVALDQDQNGPFHKRIKRLGVTTEGRERETLAQATFIAPIMKCITADEKADRDALLRGKKLKKVDNDELRRHPLRNLFIDKEDIQIGRLVSNYFTAISLKWEDAWENREAGNMLSKTNGYKAAMKIFPAAYLSLADAGAMVSTEQFLELFDRSELQDNDFTTDRFIPGSGGQAELARVWREELGLE